MSRLTFHLVPQPAWAARPPGVAYRPAGFDAEGFVHCTDGEEELVRVANRHYAGDPRPFLVLTLDLERTGSPWRFDDPGRRYPHVYGPIDPAAVLEVRGMPRAPDGTFLGPPWPVAGTASGQG